MTTNWQNTAPTVHNNVTLSKGAKPNYSEIPVFADPGLKPGQPKKLPPVAAPKKGPGKQVFKDFPSLLSIYHG